ncbi:MAG: hypothetical protein JRN52_06170 [Nitrososphaerota archaeon]|nr:hypothetical protein [Nitrososphaerota archaeon]
MSAIRFVPIIVAILLAGTLVVYAQATVPTTTTPTTVTLRVGYPDSLDESDVSDLYAAQLLKAEGINVVPTFYDAPPLSYKGLISGQQDIAWDTTSQTFALGPLSGEQTTCVGSYELGGTFLSISNGGITSLSQMVGKTAEDFGTGTATRSLNLYWYKAAGIPITTTGVNASAVYLKNGGGNVARVHDLENNVTQAIVVDDFILSDFMSPSINNTAHNGPFHVLAYAPSTYWSQCFAVKDSWLSNKANQQVIVKYLEAMYQAQRKFIVDPAFMVSFAEQQLPLTAPSEIQFTSTLYPAIGVYWGWGAYNLQGPMSLNGMFAGTNQFYMDANIISSPVQNSSVAPYGVVNKWFEYQALQALGPFNVPSCESWITPAFTTMVQSSVPSSLGGISSSGTCPSS